MQDLSIKRVAFQVLTLRQFWLLGYEFPATLFLFTMEALYVVTTAKKGGSISTINLFGVLLTTFC